jgi:uncharacterized protein
VGVRTYLDACTLVYLVEQPNALGNVIRETLERTPTEFCISDLVRLECLVTPLRANDHTLVRKYERAFSEFTML